MRIRTWFKNILAISILLSGISSLNAQQITENNDALEVKYNDIWIELEKLHALNKELSLRLATQESVSDKILVEKNDKETESIRVFVLEQLQAQDNNFLILLIAAAALMLTVLTIAYKGLSTRSKSLEKKAEKKFNSVLTYNSSQIQASLYNHISYTIWQESQLANSYDEKISRIDFAIKSIRFALSVASNLSLTSDGELIGQIKINLAYFLAQRHADKDRIEALTLAQEAYELSKSMKISRWYDWHESYAFVFFQYGDDAQKEHSCKIIHELSCDPNILDAEWRKDTKKEWKEILKD